MFLLIGEPFSKERNKFDKDTITKILDVEFNLRHLTYKESCAISEQVSKNE